MATAFAIQAVLIVFFALRLWAYDTALEVGWIVYAAAVPALVISALLARSRLPWHFWIGGPLFAIWALFGFYVDIVKPIAWRSPILPSVFVPYVVLYLAAQMFYWWPLARIRRPLWFAYAVVFAISTTLNLASHG